MNLSASSAKPGDPTYFLEGIIHDKSEMADFEGPLSLILLLLSKNKIEIRDIKISDILDQYLEYLNAMEKLDLEIASEFVQMASYLLYIKTRMLLTEEKEVTELEQLIASLEQLKCKDTYAAVKTVTPMLEAAAQTGLHYLSRPPEPLPKAAGIVHGIGRAAGGFRQIANADAAVIRKMPIAFLHTAPKIVLRGVSHLICAALDFFVGVDIRLWPAPSLVKARQYKDQPDLRITLPQAEDNLRCQSIKSQGTTCAEIAIALLNQLDQSVLQALGNFGQIICRQFPMSGETSRSGFHVYHLITTTCQYNNIYKPLPQRNCSL